MDRNTCARINEIKGTINRLKRTGEYELYSSDEAEAKTEQIALMLNEAFPLTDKDVDAIIANIPEYEIEPFTTEESEAFVHRAIRRSQGLDEGEDISGVPAYPRPSGGLTGGATAIPDDD